MTVKERGIVTEPLTISQPSPTRWVRCEAFTHDDAFRKAFEAAVGIAPPKPVTWAVANEGRVVWAEVKAWLVEADAEPLAERLQDVAAISDVSHAWRAIDVKGSNWRELLAHETTLDAFSPALAPGAVVAGLWSHGPVMVLVRSDAEITLYGPPSLAHHLSEVLNHLAGWV